MKRQLFKKLSFKVLGFSLLFVAPTLEAQTITDSLNFTGSTQTYTVPCGVTSITIEAYGAQGGNGAIGGNASSGGVGALGGYAKGTLTVTPGQVLNIFVGGAGTAPTGGFNGGGNGGAQNAGGGGGATDVRIGGTAAINRVITAGGGGGGGRGGCNENNAPAGIGGNGGAGGGGVGQIGNNSATAGGFAGGGEGGNFGSIQGAFGPAGIGCSGFLGQAGLTATTEVGANGGGGQSCCCSFSSSIPGGGGGGGSAGTVGCSGNSKGAGGGGGGGSSYIGGVANGITTPNLRLGNGKVIISYNNPLVATTLVAPANAICSNVNVNYQCIAVNNATSYTWNTTGGLTIVSGQGTNNVSVKSLNNGGNISVVANTPCGATPSSAAFAVNVNTTPVAALTASAYTLCAGTPSILSGVPLGGNYSVVSGNPSALNGNLFNAATAGLYQVAYTFTNAANCTDSAQINLNVNCVLGLDNTIINNSSLKIMPNPNNGIFTISSNVEIDGTIELINELGQVVYKNRMNGLSQQMDVPYLSTGIYYIKVGDGKTVSTNRLSIVK
jgi:PKD-like domain/Secretion system C-terminal sorting domain/Glycine rich protein